MLRFLTLIIVAILVFNWVYPPNNITHVEKEFIILRGWLTVFLIMALLWILSVEIRNHRKKYK